MLLKSMLCRFGDRAEARDGVSSSVHANDASVDEKEVMNKNDSPIYDNIHLYKEGTRLLPEEVWTTCREGLGG
jgi:hypothetical protein